MFAQAEQKQQGELGRTRDIEPLRLTHKRTMGRVIRQARERLSRPHGRTLRRITPQCRQKITSP
jgi:hypothetical protein